MKYIVDRIVNGIAVLETEGSFVEVEITLLPVDVKEGSVLRKENGCFFVDSDSEAERRKRLFLLQQKLKNKKL